MSGPADKNKEFVLEGEDGVVDDAYLHSTILPELAEEGANDLVAGDDDGDLSDLDDLDDL
jgi:hypothetical protein